jgi:Mg-chelatase subunit ChlD
MSRLLVGLVAAAVAVPAGLPASGAAARSAALDVLIAIDTTGSMGPSIRQAQRDVSRLVEAAKAAAPAARFAVVQFKDMGDLREYELLQPMTPNAPAVATALSRLAPSGGGDNPEALNVIFRNSYTHDAIGWRKVSRKVVVVVSDAEPHGAAAAGFSGCLDASPDPHGLNTARELREMRKAERTLLLVRQASTATVSLQCYQSLAAAAYRGGAARDGGSDVVGAIASLLERIVSEAPRTTSRPKTPRPKTGTGADTTPPSVHALPSRGARGTVIRLLYRVKDGSGRSSERVTVYRGATVLTKSGWASFGPATGATYYFDFPAPSTLTGTLRFCVQSRDPSGNVSARSCAAVTVG